MTRTTIQRKLVLDAVSLLGSHPSPEEVYFFIAKTHPTISKATVYRNLNLLANEGRLLKVQTPDGADRFDHNHHNHYHIQCEKCGKIFDINMDYMPKIYNKIKDSHGFIVSSHDITFKGTCPKCCKAKE